MSHLWNKIARCVKCDVAKADASDQCSGYRVDTRNLGPIKIDTPKVERSARLTRDALCTLREDAHTAGRFDEATALELMIERAQDQTLAKLYRMIR